MKQMKVSENVHKQLSNIKSQEGHTSFDSAIRALIKEYNYAKEWRNPELLKELHHNEEMTLAEMARELGCTSSTISKWLDKYNIDKVQNDPRSHIGEKHWNSKDIEKRKYGHKWEKRRQEYRDHNSMECAICGISEDETGKTHHLHHLDQSDDRVTDASDVDDDGLVPLCPPHHMTVDVNGFDVNDIS